MTPTSTINGKHIRNALEGIERNLARNQTLRDFLRKQLKPMEYDGLTHWLDELVNQLKNPTSDIYREFGEDLSQEILEILARTKYIQ